MRDLPSVQSYTLTQIKKLQQQSPVGNTFTASIKQEKIIYPRINYSMSRIFRNLLQWAFLASIENVSQKGAHMSMISKRKRKPGLGSIPRFLPLLTPTMCSWLERFASDLSLPALSETSSSSHSLRKANAATHTKPLFRSELVQQSPLHRSGMTREAKHFRSQRFSTTR